MSYFKDHAPRLFNMGYEVLPIVPGDKRPAVKNWQSIDITKAQINAWNLKHTGAGVGIRLGKVCAIDVDVYDQEVADQLRMSFELLYPSMRTGQPPKFLVPFRTETTMVKKKIAFEDLFGQTHAIELLAKGQQFVAYHDHPETKKPFVWDTDLVAREALPVLDDNAISDIFNEFKEIAEEAGWKLTQNTLSKEAQGSSDVVNQGQIADIKPSLDLNEEDINAILTQIDPTDHDTWIKVGAAIHHQYDGSSDGYTRFKEWSAATKADNYSATDCRKRWNSFNSRKRNAITFASLLKETGYKKPIQLDVVQERVDRKTTKDSSRISADSVPTEADTLDKFLTRYAFVPAGNFVLDKKRPVDSALIEIAAFRNLTAPQRIEVDCPVSKTNPDGVKLEPIHKFWLCHEDRLTVEGDQYKPGEPNRLFQSDDGRLWLNTAHFPQHATADKDKSARLATFSKHLDYLIPIEEQRKWFWQWLAFCVQRPAQRCKVTPLHISLPHRTGRGFVVKVLERLLGSWNVSKADMPELCGEGSKGQYHDYLSKSLVCCIDEVYEGGKRYQVSDKIRDKLTEDRLNVNLKYGGKGTIDVYTNFFWMSNHNDALVIPKEDGRIYVIQGPERSKPLAYYDKIYDWQKSDGNIAALWHHLQSINLSDFNWKVAEMTDAKTTMIEYNYTATEEVFHDFIGKPPFPFMSLPQIVAGIHQESLKQGQTMIMEPTQVRKLLQKMSPVNLSMQITMKNNNRCRPWMLDKKRISLWMLSVTRLTLQK